MEAYFSNSYEEARSRFLEAARSAKAELFAYAIDHDSISDLTIDVAIVGKEYSHTIVISSAVHGVEGFFGSAVQLALLEQLNQSAQKPAIRYVFIHAVNPYGFSQVRRVNEDNIDLNRNFLIGADEYKGAPEGYAELDAFLNPKSPPSRLEPFKLIALWIIFRKGLQTLMQAVAAGQFEYPKGLFFGGKSASKSAQIIEQNCDAWLAGSEQITHIDLHTGLGKSGDYILLLIEAADSENYPWYINTYGENNVEAQTKPEAGDERTAYTVRGSFGEWMQHRYGAGKYRFMAAEFGTHHVLRVLAALRADNRAHFHSPNDEPASWVRDELLECLCPKDVKWRNKVIISALDIIEKAQH